MDPQHRWALLRSSGLGAWRPRALLRCKLNSTPPHRFSRRLVLEAATEALAGAGASLPPSRTGVFVGISWTEYARLAADAGAPVTAYTAQGAVLRCAAGQVPLLPGSLCVGARGCTTRSLNCHASMRTHAACALGEWLTTMASRAQQWRWILPAPPRWLRSTLVRWAGASSANMRSRAVAPLPRLRRVCIRSCPHTMCSS